MVELILSRTESCIKVQESKERSKGGMKAVGTSWGQTDKSSETHNTQHPKGQGTPEFQG